MKNEKDTNTGTKNSGHRNSGHRNSGHWNSGDWNSGDCNSGDWNSGSWNSGSWNSGSWNRGDRNSGDWNSGDWNSGNWNSGDCNENTPTVRIFDKDSGWEFNGEKHKMFKNILENHSKKSAEWIKESDMTDQEKEDNPSYKTTGGYLKVYTLKERTYVPDLTEGELNFLLKVPNFDAGKLKRTTGLDLTMYESDLWKTINKE